MIFFCVCAYVYVQAYVHFGVNGDVSMLQRACGLRQP